MTVMATVNDGIRSNFLANLKALRSCLPLVCDGDSDGIHDARVATRRLRAALPLLSAAGFTEGVEQASPTVKALGRALGRAREEDEALRLLNEIERRSPGAAAAAATLRARLLPRQLRKRRQLIKAVESLDLETLDRVGEMLGRQSGFPRPWGVAPSRSALRAAIGRRAETAERKVHHAAGVYFPNRAHRARIAIKKLRYLAELLERGARARKPTVRALRSAQEALGNIHDREMVLSRLSELMDEEDVHGARELARALEAECRSLFESYRAMRPAVLSACADLTAWAQRSVESRPRQRLLVVGAVALPSAAILLASRARRAVERSAAPGRAVSRSDQGVRRAIPEARRALDVR
jgi:CHAD domain-containing protein